MQFQIFSTGRNKQQITHKLIFKKSVKTHQLADGHLVAPPSITGCGIGVKLRPLNNVKSFAYFVIFIGAFFHKK